MLFTFLLHFYFKHRKKNGRKMCKEKRKKINTKLTIRRRLNYLTDVKTHRKARTALHWIKRNTQQENLAGERFYGYIK